MRSALRQVLLADPMPWAMKAEFAWDFLSGRARFNRANVGSLENTPNWSYTRADAQTAYAQNAAGALIPFASGQLRRTDKGVLIEGARTNLCLRSQEFDNASWVKSNCTVTADQFAAPDGTVTADKIEGAAGAGSGCQNYQAWAATATSFVYSVFVHQGSGATDANKISIYNNTTATILAGGTFDYSTGVFTQTTGTGAIVQTLGNGWWRVCLPVSSGVTATDVIRVYAGFSGVAETPGEYCYGWGAQIEAGVTFPSSYIPTTTASASRAADALVVTSPGVDYPLTLFAEFERAVDTGGTEVIFATNVVGDANRAQLSVSSADLLRYQTVSGGVADGDQTVATAIPIGAVQKAAFRTTTNDVRGARNGTLGNQDAATTAIAAAPTWIEFGTLNSATPLFGYLRRTAIRLGALDDAGLQAWTA